MSVYHHQHHHHEQRFLKGSSSNASAADGGGVLIMFLVVALLGCAVILWGSSRGLSRDTNNRNNTTSLPVATAIRTTTPMASDISNEGTGLSRLSGAVVVATAMPISFGEVVVSESVQEKLSVDSMKRSVATVFVSTTGKTALSNKGKSDVVQIRCEKDGRHYFVASDLPEKEKAAGMLAEISRRAQYLMQAVDEQLDGNRRIVALDGVDITDNMKALLRKHYKIETPLAEYHNPSDMTVGSNSDKGVVIETCLRSKFDPTEWSSINTLFRIHCHELAHSADFDYRSDGEDGHGPIFRRLHKYLLGVSENLGIYNCAEYTKSGGAVCGVKLTESYQCGDKPLKSETK